MKNIIKKVPVIALTVVMLTGFAQAQERLFKAPVAKIKVINVMTQSTQSDGWSIVKKSDDKQLIVAKTYTQRILMHRKPVKRVQGNFFVELSFTKDGYKLQAISSKGKVLNSLNHKEKRLFSGLETEIEKQLASTLI